MEYTRYEKARIIGARALQIAMGAPLLIAMPEDAKDPIALSKAEFAKNMIPMTVKRSVATRAE